MLADARAAAARLRERSDDPVFTLGFCMFGGHSWRLASTDLGAAGCMGFYGRPSTAADVVDQMSAPLLLLVAGDDQATSPQENAAFDQALTDAGKEHKTVVYDGAPHSFFDRSYAAVGAGLRRRVARRCSASSTRTAEAAGQRALDAARGRRASRQAVQSHCQVGTGALPQESGRSPCAGCPGREHVPAAAVAVGDGAAPPVGVGAGGRGLGRQGGRGPASPIWWRTKDSAAWAGGARGCGRGRAADRAATPAPVPGGRRPRR